jgi:hypothetical protein
MTFMAAPTARFVFHEDHYGGGSAFGLPPEG